MCVALFSFSLSSAHWYYYLLINYCPYDKSRTDRPGPIYDTQTVYSADFDYKSE